MRHILILLFLFVYSFVVGQNDNDVLMTIGGKDVTVGEFKYIYEKNNKDKANYSKETIDEYLDLYKKFKLKVVDAEANGLADEQSVNSEINVYKNKLSKSYFQEKEIYKNVVKEVFDRKKYDINVSHIYTGRDNAKALRVLEKLKNGANFEMLAKQYSDDSETASSGGNLGYLTAMLGKGFYGFENAMYNTSVGDFSEIIKTSIGYHIIKVNKRRANKGQIKVAQIVVFDQKNPKGPTAKQLIDQAYAELKAGAQWNEVLVKYNSDKTAIQKQGVLPVFGINEYESSFEDAAFELKNDGDISRPIRTSIGYHIIKRLEKPKNPTFHEFSRDQEGMIKRSRRYAIQKNDINKILLSKGKLVNYVDVLSDLIKNIDEEDFRKKDWTPKAMPTKTLFTFGGNEYSNNDFIAFMKSKARARSLKNFDKKTSIKRIYNVYLENLATEYAHRVLVEDNADYTNLFREYKEGILLFETTKRQVWDKAANDEEAIKKYYAKHKKKYRFNKRAEVINYTVAKGFKGNKKKLLKCAKRNKKNPEKVLQEFDKEGAFIKYTKRIVDRSTVGKPQYVANEDGETFTVLQKKIPARTQTLKECRGFVVTDYQNQLEREWIKSLEKKYKVNINERIYNALIK